MKDIRDQHPNRSYLSTKGLTHNLIVGVRHQEMEVDSQENLSA